MRTYRKIIGKYIKRRIDALGVDQVLVARCAGINPSNLSRIINGRYSVGVDILERICRVIGLHVAFIEPFTIEQTKQVLELARLQSSMSDSNIVCHEISAN